MLLFSATPKMDLDADFVYDYRTLRIGGLVFAGVIVFLSILLLAGNSIRKCGKSKVRDQDGHNCFKTSAF
uniref:FXYD domain-containing ion transport regulator n=1 Tax=Paramormyrops kingsleyae TaxID=1676925 RepID=A0A3B3QYJ8_9TELE